MGELLKRNKIQLLFFGAIIANVLVWSVYFSAPDQKMHINVFDVGQGDSILVQTRGGYTILVDGGPDGKVMSALGKKIPFYSKNIDLLVLTHPQSDHYGGLIEVIKSYQIKTLWINGESSDSKFYREFEELVLEKNIKKVVVSSGDQLLLSDNTEIKVISPKKKISTSDPNVNSIVLHISYGDFDAYLTGDADSQVQPYSSKTEPVELLKVPHHGGKNALKESFVLELSPEISVISVGARNPYGHPRADTIDILKRSGTKIFRTDKNGSVEIVSDGDSWYTVTN